MNLNKAFAMRLSQLLKEKNMSKYKLEKLTGLAHSSIIHIFNEVNNDINFSTIYKCCYALNVTLNEFFESDLFDFDKINF